MGAIRGAIRGGPDFDYTLFQAFHPDLKNSRQNLGISNCLTLQETGSEKVSLGTAGNHLNRLKSFAGISRLSF